MAMAAATIPTLAYTCSFTFSFTNHHRFSQRSFLSFRNAEFRNQRKDKTRTKKKKDQQHYTLFALPFDISPPPIDELDDENVADASPVISTETFADDNEALHEAYNGVVVANLSHFGRIRVSGEDRIQFLHNQSTANFDILCEGQGCDTVFVTPTARTIDIAHAWIMKNAVTLVVSPDTAVSITNMLTKYIFPADKVEVQDITEQTRFFILFGPESNRVSSVLKFNFYFLCILYYLAMKIGFYCDKKQVMKDLNLGELIGKPYGTHQHYNVNGLPITVGVGSVISEGGFSLMMSSDGAEPVWKAIVSRGAVCMSCNAWEKLRILEGRPAPGKELTKEFNVLEAGLWNSISQSKGCYKGQETISRLITYNGVKQRLWGIRLSGPAELESPIIVDGKKVGKLTSYTPGKEGSGHFGLGYIKSKAASEGDTVIVGENILGEVVEVPFLARQSLPSQSPSLSSK